MKRYKFSAQILAATGGGAAVLFPYDVEEEFGTKGKVPVKATFNDVPCTGTLIRYGHPQHMLPILKAIRQEIGKGPGDQIEVVLWREGAIRTLELRVQFEALMKNEGLFATFEKLSYTHRKECCRWIATAKKEETRWSRLEKAIAMLKTDVKTPG